MADSDKDDKDGSSNIWILIPLMALMIPIIAVGSSSEQAAAFWAVLATALLLGGGTFAARSLMTHRHRLRMIEIEAQAKIAAEERHQLEAANRILDADSAAAELREQLRAERARAAEREAGQQPN